MHKIVAIVGRPNVGKSTLFNRLTGKKNAIVHHTSGVTRDRNYGEAEWLGKRFFVIDTGGFVPDSDKGFDKAIREQILIAIEESDRILLVVDAESGIHPIDLEFAKLLRKNLESKNIILVANKSDNQMRELDSVEFYKLGLGEPHNIAAINGRNVAELLDVITGDITETPEDTDKRIKLSVIGRPNAGKSSIVNAILGEERNIVSTIPGTTRDSIDSILKYHGEEIVLIDTAGLKRKSKIKRSEALEFYSTVRTYKAIQRCDVAILVIDATLIMENFIDYPDMKSAVFKLDRQDTRIIEDVQQYKKGLLIVINKWDLVENKTTMTEKIIRDKITEHLRTMYYLKFIFISALTKQRIHKVVETAKEIYEERSKEIKTSELNDILQKDIKSKPPQSVNGKEVKINYITQVKRSPPVIAFYCNDPKGVKENYKRYLEKSVRSHFGFSGVPLTLIFKKKN